MGGILHGLTVSIAVRRGRGRAAYFSGWMLTRSKPSTCSITSVSEGAAAGSRRVDEEAHLGGQIFVGHVDGPDARAAAHVEDAGLPVLRHGRLVQLVSACNGKQLVVDVHAILLELPVASALGPAGAGGGNVSLPRRTGTCRCPAGSRGRHGHSPGSCCSERARAIWRSAVLAISCSRIELSMRRTERGEGRVCTHPFDAIVTIGAALRSGAASQAGGCGPRGRRPSAQSRRPERAVEPCLRPRGA